MLFLSPFEPGQVLCAQRLVNKQQFIWFIYHTEFSQQQSEAINYVLSNCFLALQKFSGGDDGFYSWIFLGGWQIRAYLVHSERTYVFPVALTAITI